MRFILQQWMVPLNNFPSHYVCLFVQFNCSFFSLYISHSFLSLSFFFSLSLYYLSRNPGKLYGGLLNVSHMGTYSADKQFLNIFFKETTIIRRLNVHGIKVRAMVVVSIYKIQMFLIAFTVHSITWHNNNLEEVGIRKKK